MARGLDARWPCNSGQAWSPGASATAHDVAHQVLQSCVPCSSSLSGLLADHQHVQLSQQTKQATCTGRQLMQSRLGSTLRFAAVSLLAVHFDRAKAHSSPADSVILMWQHTRARLHLSHASAAHQIVVAPQYEGQDV